MAKIQQKCLRANLPRQMPDAERSRLSVDEILHLYGLTGPRRLGHRKGVKCRENLRRFAKVQEMPAVRRSGHEQRYLLRRECKVLWQLQLALRCSICRVTLFAHNRWGEPRRQPGGALNTCDNDWICPVVVVGMKTSGPAFMTGWQVREKHCPTEEFVLGSPARRASPVRVQGRPKILTMGAGEGRIFSRCRKPARSIARQGFLPVDVAHPCSAARSAAGRCK